MRGEADTASKVAFLRRASSHPEKPSAIAVVETHFAWVFIGDRVVRKLKKPIRTPWLDFSTLERRRAACVSEVELNCALAPDTYLGVEPLVRTATGGLALEGPGEVVDAVVRMRRLPAARTLDRMAGRLWPGDLAPVVARLTAFYGRSGAARRDPEARMVQLLASLGDLEGRLSRGPLRHQHALVAALLAFADCRAPTLRARASDGLVVDAHGDLRPEHVYLTTPPRILDRLEFGAAHRAIDWLEDLALLAVDLEAHGHGWLGDRVKRAVATGLGDAPPPALWCFYRGWRAVLRAQLAVEHLARADGLPPAAERQAWLSRARSFLGLAKRHIGRLRG